MKNKSSVSIKLLFFITSGIAMVLFVILGTWQQPTLPVQSPVEIPKFKDYNMATTTKTFHMVCLTHKNVRYHYKENPLIDTWYARTWKYTFFDRRCKHQQKDITVYIENMTDFKPSAYKLGFKLNFKSKAELPKDYSIRNQTAYFLGNREPREPQNFYHFVRQIYFPLHWMMTSTNSLHPDAQNVVFYPAPYAICEKDKRVVYHNPSAFKMFTDILQVKNKLELSAFVDMLEPHKVCYENAVFTSELFLSQGRESIEYFKNKLDIKSDVCKPKTLTIINRASYRIILNARKLTKIAQELGYNAKEVFMEKLTMRQQAQLMHCTDILIGVHGAALQWAYFMKDDSTAIEIAWPDKALPFFYSLQSGRHSTGEVGVVRPLKFLQLKGKAVRNLKAPNIYAKDLFKIKINFTEQQAIELFEDKRNYGQTHKPVLNMGKLHDTIIDEDEFKRVLMLAHG